MICGTALSFHWDPRREVPSVTFSRQGNWDSEMKDEIARLRGGRTRVQTLGRQRSPDQMTHKSVSKDPDADTPPHFFLLGNYKHLKFEQPNRVVGLEHRHWGQTAWL